MAWVKPRRRDSIAIEFRCDRCERMRIGRRRKGMCHNCYQAVWKWRRAGLPDPVVALNGRPGETLPVRERLLRNVSPGYGGCWLYTGPVNPVTGYGWMGFVDGPNRSAHRISYETFKGPIPEGLVMDHLCRVRRCCNPDHLEAVTPKENTRRAVGHPAQLNALKTHCKWGHPFSGDNVRVDVGPDGSRHRVCRTCRKADMARFLARRTGVTK